VTVNSIGHCCFCPLHQTPTSCSYPFQLGWTHVPFIFCITICGIMNPSRPRPSGLPSGPASRLAGRPRPDQPPTSYTREYTSTPSSSSRHIRAQRSLASVTPSREPRSLAQTSSEFRRANSTRDHDREAKYPRQSDGYSTSSEVSSVSSFLGRMSGDRAGYESSHTSLEEDYDPPKGDRRIEAKSMKARVDVPHQSFEG
jgi:hypothetical protein